MSHAKLATGHAPSPYLRRCRIPNLGSMRLYEDPLSPEDELGKIELIKAKMEELTRQALTTKSKQNKKDNTERSFSTTSIQQQFFHPSQLFEDDQKNSEKVTMEEHVVEARPTHAASDPIRIVSL